MPLRIVRFVLVALAIVAMPAAAADYSRAGPYEVDSSTVTVKRADDSTFEALLYVPGPAQSSAPFPAITFGHGFLTPPGLYDVTLEHLASWGYVVIATKSGLEPFPRHDLYALDMLDCLGFLEAETSRPGSSLFGTIDTNRFGASGHSMGGGASILAAAMDTRVRVVANMAAANTRPSAQAVAAVLDIPTCYLAGSEDRIAPLDRHTGPIFEGTRAPALLAVIQGGSHCGFVGVPLPDAVCDEATMPLERQLALSHHLLTAFFELYLRGRNDVWQDVWGLPLVLSPEWAVDPNPGSVIAPYAVVRRARSGQVIEVPFRVMNPGTEAASFVLDAAGTLVVESIAPRRTALLQPGEEAHVTVRASLAPGSRVAGFLQVSAFEEDDPKSRSVSALILRRAR